MNVSYGLGFVKSPALVTLDPMTGVMVMPSDDPIENRAWIVNLTRTLLASGEKSDLPVKHTFLDGMYMRELFIPKGTLLVGKIHKQPCMNVVSRGDISVMTETGSARVKAGYSIVSPAGIQKVGYAHEDTVFLNVFRTEETDPEKVEQAIAWSGFEGYAALEGQHQGAIE